MNNKLDIDFIYIYLITCRLNCQYLHYIAFTRTSSIKENYQLDEYYIFKRQNPFLFFSSLDQFVRSFNFSVIHSFSYSFTHSFIHSFIYSFIHSFVRSFVRSFVYSAFIHSYKDFLLPNLRSFVMNNDVQRPIHVAPNGKRQQQKSK